MSNERLRLKDRILDRIAKAIKEIQGLSSCAGSQPIVLTNERRPVQKLVENLDHAFLHGLRHVTCGYWVIVPQFTRKDVIKQINMLNNITTDLGRGRAWLYMALNENLIESYLRCFAENVKVVRKYYVEHSIMRDDQRLLLLQTLTAGLDFATFDLDLTVPFLDLTSYLPSKKPPKEDEEDRISHHSIDTMSMSSYTSGILEDCGTPSDISSYTYKDGQSDQGIHSLEYYRQDSGDSSSSSVTRGAGDWVATKDAKMVDEVKSTVDIVDNDTLEKKNRPQRPTSLGHTFRSVRIDTKAKEEDFEVIHINGKRTKKLNKKKKSPSGKISPAVDSLTKFNEMKVVMEEAVVWGDAMTIGQDAVKSTNQFPPLDANQTQLADQIAVIEDSVPQLANPVSSLDLHVLNVKKRLANRAAQSQDQISPTVENCDEKVKPVSQNQESIFVDNLQSQKTVNSDSLDDSIAQTISTANGTVDEATDVVMTANTVAMDIDEADVLQKDNDNLSVTHDISDNHIEGSGETAIVEDGMSVTENSDSKGETPPLEAAMLEKYESLVLVHEADMKIDNNTKLYLMLEIFKNESEEFMKMIHMSTGYMEGDVKPVFILLTDQAIYLLRKGDGDVLYQTESMITYNDIDFLSVNVNYQSVTLVCANRRNQYCLSTGDEQLTRYFLSVLMKVMEEGSRTRELPSILRDATTQLIAMKKFASVECRCELNDVNIHHYGLVHWEDLTVKSSSPNVQKPSTYKQGTLLYKTWDSYLFGGITWKPGYFLLRNGVFYRLLQRHDPIPQLSISLKSTDFGGCRRIRSGERPYSFELILPDKTSLELAAKDDSEASEWLHAICSSVALGMDQCSPNASPCIACCLILTDQKFITCHEDFQTGFFRCLASCKIEDIGGITVDPDNRYYCIVEFEPSEVSSDHEQPWVLYFNSPGEENKFETAMCKAWKNIFQVDLPVYVIDNKTIKQRCREQQSSLQSAWTKSDHVTPGKESTPVW
ncbi:pleckstrin homology domain-containing family M member 2-like [Saccoglossus kowalevskii]|uniref:Pleckstrin homology domain-containing family M member 2-like n=1 Tax=Saccoglossus kowalevskii TaxID=10224 RepID=A0ABM0GV55_SACKO|nr:PREDICTED: pleckstrin homology domain-containing family M member 2-like [Saccoglossus kowalevskii]